MKVVISIGGSIIVPDEVNYRFLIKLKKTIFRLSKKYKIVIVTGGGKTARKYIKALEKEGATEYVQDVIGIECTRLNARLVSSFFGISREVPKTIEEASSVISSFRVVVCGGLGKGKQIGAGKTSDGTCAEVAAHIGAHLFINMTNVKGLYNKDPNKYKDAKFIPMISYGDFNKIMSKVKERPGEHFILDSYAAKIITRKKIKTIILKGVKNLQGAIDGKRFVGTVIS